jgi:SulP family sulfate permease
MRSALRATFTVKAVHSGPVRLPEPRPVPTRKRPLGRRGSGFELVDTFHSSMQLPVLQGLLPLRASQVSTEIIAGITLAALAVPEVMGYTKIAGTPVVTGLYTLLIPMALFALFGSSRHLVVGADSATAAILAAGLLGIAPVASNQYVALASVLALMAAGLLILARLIGLGFLADFLSRTVLVGFLTGVGIQVALGQIAGMLGLPAGGHGTLGRLYAASQVIDQTKPYVVALSLSVLAVIFGAKLISRKIPGALIAVVGATVASWAMGLNARGVAVLGAVPSGLPHLGLPHIGWSWHLLQTLLPTAFAMFVVILTQSAATSRAYAARYNDHFSEDTDLLGLGLANLGAGLSGTFVVNGSPTKTEMVDGAGGRSQLAHLTTVAVVLLMLLFLTGPLAQVPEAALAAVVFVIGTELIDLRGMRRIYAARRGEFWVALATAVTVVLVGVEQGIVLAMVLSLLEHVRHGYRPRNELIVHSAQGGRRAAPVESGQQLEPGLLVYRFTHSMYYANARLLSSQVKGLVKNARATLRWFCIDASAVDDLDFSAAETLRTIQAELQKRGVRLVFVQVMDDLNPDSRNALEEIVGSTHFYPTIDDLVHAYRQTTGVPAGKAE